jgi:hypothetical protein
MAAWVLNLDADLELARNVEDAGSYTPSKRLLELMRPHAERLRGSLLDAGDVLVDERSPRNAARGQRGRAFCPTPRAVGLLRRAGAIPDPYPPFAVLRRVNSRRFASSLGPTLRGAAFVTQEAAVLAMVTAPPPVGRGWRVKHAFGMAGRNQRVLRSGEADRRDDDFVRFLRAGLASGGVEVEPDVEIVEEYAIHGFVREDGDVRVGSVVRQRCDARGAWLASEPTTGEALGELRATLAKEAADVARALFLAGYHGPFGVDAFTYRGASGDVLLQPRGEINARYSMGFTTGFGPPP